MPDVNITTLRAKLPDYLARVARGERLRVTSRGRVIAEITPPAPDDVEVQMRREQLRGSVLRFDDPFAPVLDEGEWDLAR